MCAGAAFYSCSFLCRLRQACNDTLPRGQQSLNPRSVLDHRRRPRRLICNQRAQSPINTCEVECADFSGCPVPPRSAPPAIIRRRAGRCKVPAIRANAAALRRARRVRTAWLCILPQSWEFSHTFVLPAPKLTQPALYAPKLVQTGPPRALRRFVVGCISFYYFGCAWMEIRLITGCSLGSFTLGDFLRDRQFSWEFTPAD